MATPPTKKKGYQPPDLTKRYAVVERPTDGPKKGTVTRVFGTDLAWADANALKDSVAATRRSKYATVVEDESVISEHDMNAFAQAAAAQPPAATPSVLTELGVDALDAELDELVDDANENRGQPAPYTTCLMHVGEPPSGAGVAAIAAALEASKLCGQPVAMQMGPEQLPLCEAHLAKIEAMSGVDALVGASDDEVDDALADPGPAADVPFEPIPKS